MKARFRVGYHTDLTDPQWELLQYYFPRRSHQGRPPHYRYREILNAIFYLLRTGGAWRHLPYDYPDWRSVYGYFHRWMKSGLWELINRKICEKVRLKVDRNKRPSAAIIDSQSVKTTDQGGTQGFDAGKLIKGRKRHILVDVMGMVLKVVVHSAGIQDRDGAKMVLNGSVDELPRLQLVWADGSYSGELVGWLDDQHGLELEIVRKPKGTKGFKLLGWRWIVERTFGWLNKYRRLSKDYERLTDTSESMIYGAMIHIMLRRLA